jgi:hypothetical protein
MSDKRFTVEQTGASDWGVWDTRTESWSGDFCNRDDAEDAADSLNGCDDNATTFASWAAATADKPASWLTFS